MGDWEPGLECQILLSFADWVAAGGERSGEGSGKGSGEGSGHSGKEGGGVGGKADGGAGGGSGGGGGATSVAGGSTDRGGGDGGNGGDGGGGGGGGGGSEGSGGSGGSDVTADSERFAEPPSVYLASLSERYPNREKCEEVWSGEHMAYRCRDCGLSESSCMCVACFDPDQVCYFSLFSLYSVYIQCEVFAMLTSSTTTDPVQHIGHDYRLYRSSSGGCCDCGDTLAWKTTGFCGGHSGPDPSFDPSTQLPPSVQEGAKLAAQIVSRITSSLVASCEHDRELDLVGGLPGAEAEERRRRGEREVVGAFGKGIVSGIERCVRWIETFAEHCSGFRRIMCRVLSTPLPSRLLHCTSTIPNYFGRMYVPPSLLIHYFFITMVQ